MNKKYIVRLTDEERKVCEAVIKDQKGKSEKLRRAQILLKADVDGPGWKDEKISEASGGLRPLDVETLGGSNGGTGSRRLHQP